MLFVVDFDGTIAPLDTVDGLLERYAGPEWRQIEEEWVAGRINSQQCMASQLALVTAKRASVEDFLQSVVIDPFFPEFVRYARTFAELAVVSDGIDYPIRHVLGRLGVPIYANGLEFRDRGLGISFPHADATCTVMSGVCKCAVARSLDAKRGLFTVLIGDGRSDRCIARYADHVFAKGSLRRYCEDEGIIHTPFDTFHDVLAVIRGWNARHYEEKLRESVCPSPTP